MIRIYPSILEQTVPAFSAQLNKLLPFFDHFQLDIADGILVNNRTITIDDIINHFEQNPADLTNELSLKTFEMHLMVEDFEPALARLEELKKYLNIVGAFIHFQPFARHSFIVPNTAFHIGIVLNPEDSVSDNWKVLHIFDTIQLMTINPGKQGQPFIPEVLSKIEQLRQLDFEGEIILDGGINDQTFPTILTKEFQPTAVCPGSYFHAENPEEALQKLLDLTGSGHTELTEAL